MIGKTLSDRYLLVRKLGFGGMGTVYLAKDIRLEGFQVALKVLQDDISQDKAYVKRFRRELELMNTISHPNVVRTYHAGQDGQINFFTMEYVLGQSLADLLDTRKFPVDEIIHLLNQICHGLAAIHNTDIIHRDLKPGNVIINQDGIAKITDFGLARRSVSTLTTKGRRLGSICYMAPEYWSGQQVTKLIDLYSIGVMLYELITGAPPFDGDDPAALMRSHLKEIARPPIEKNPELLLWLNDLTMQLLAKKPADRPQSVIEIIKTINANSKSTR